MKDNEINSILAAIEAALGGDPYRPVPVKTAMTDAQVAEENARHRRNHAELYAKYGEPGPYNGVVGDSCRCDMCVLRRRVDMVDLGKDLYDGVPSKISKQQVYDGYNGQVPEWAKTDHLLAFANDRGLDPVRLDEIKNWKAPSKEEVTASARRGIVHLFGEGTPEIARFDEVNTLMAKGDKTLVELARVDQLMAEIDKDMERAIGKQVSITLASILNKPLRYTQ